jgi:hypothetical protein
LSRNRLPNGLSNPIRLATNRGKYGQVNFPPFPHVTHVPTSLLCRQRLRFGQGLPGRSEPHPAEIGEAPLMDAVRKISLPQRFQKSLGGREKTLETYKSVRLSYPRILDSISIPNMFLVEDHLSQCCDCVCICILSHEHSHNCWFQNLHVS